MTKYLLPAFTAALACTLATSAYSGGPKDKGKTPKAPEVSSEQAKPVDESAKNVAMYRHVIMDGMGKHMWAASMIIKGKVQGRDADLVTHAKALHGTSIYFTELFPQGTGPDAVETHALPAVWEKWDDFVAANTVFAEASAALVEAAKGDDAEAKVEAFKKMGAACGSCHDSFRMEDDH